MPPFNSAAVLGAGTMGRGIAQWLVQTGLKVELSDTHPDALIKAKEQIETFWEKGITKGHWQKKQVQQFKKSLKTRDAFTPKTDILIEAITEDSTLKQDAFKKLDELFDSKTIFATNTSSLSIHTLAQNLPPTRQKHFIGLHFFNPAPLMKLVEVVPGRWTSPKLISSLLKWFEEKGKRPITCSDSPGLIVNRLARHFYGEALRIVNCDDPDRFHETDNALKEVGGFPMGPFELMDFIGVDINASVTRSLWEAYHFDPRFAPHPLQEQMLRENRLGRKTKKGFL